MRNKGLLKKWFPETTTPFVANAPMYGFADAGMAAEVAKAGGFGIIGGGFDFSESSTQMSTLDAQLNKARSILSIPDSTPLPLGVGFITFKPTNFSSTAIPVLLKHRVSAVWLAFAHNDSDHETMISSILELREKENWGVKVFVQVGTVNAAIEAVRQGADVVVAQGTDAGGHQWKDSASVVALVPEVADSIELYLDREGNEREVAIVAAGGIVDGRGVVAALGLGADGVVMGTRFVATPTCPAPDAVKQVLLTTHDGVTSTLKSDVHDIFQSTNFWPTHIDGRAIIGPAYRDYLAGMSNEDNVRLYKQSLADGDKEGRKVIWAGAGVGTIKEIFSVEQVVKGTQNEAKEIMKKLASMP